MRDAKVLPTVATAATSATHLFRILYDSQGLNREPGELLFERIYANERKKYVSS
jgi:hypothetical protein